MLMCRTKSHITDPSGTPNTMWQILIILCGTLNPITRIISDATTHLTHNTKTIKTQNPNPFWFWNLISIFPTLSSSLRLSHHFLLLLPFSINYSIWKSTHSTTPLSFKNQHFPHKSIHPPLPLPSKYQFLQPTRSSGSRTMLWRREEW